MEACLTAFWKVCFTLCVTPSQAIDYFGTRTDVATVADVTETAVYHWVKQGWIPYDKQCLLQIESERKPMNGKRRIVAKRHDIPAKAA